LGLALGLAALLCLTLLALRGRVFGRYGLTWLWWNLWLACLPTLAAWAAYNLNAYVQRGRGWWVGVCGLFWLTFLPNAAYLITDVIHFRPVTGVPYWFDLIMFIAFAWTGTVLGIVSLLMMQTVIRQHCGSAVSWLFALCVLALNGFGVYLGRFQRWNSWDVVTNPSLLLADIAGRFLHPTAHLRTFAFTALFGVMFAIFYLTVIALSDWRNANMKREV
jgi:uncharacterized membrane protein